MITEMKFKGVAIVLVVMATLLSCTGKSNYDLESDDRFIELETGLISMRENLERISSNVEAEQVFFETPDADGGFKDYESFASDLESGFDELASDYGDAHQRALTILNELKADYPKADDREKLDAYDRYQKLLTAMLEDYLDYHYMVLESRILLESFEMTMTELLEYMSTGHVTSNEYNDQLYAFMERYDELLNANSLTVYDESYLGDKNEVEDVLGTLERAKEEIVRIEQQNEADMQVNRMLYSMFDDVYRSVSVIRDYMELRSGLQYSGDGKVSIDDGANLYFETYIGNIDRLIEAE